ncbi:uncharacterized protein LOC108864148 [Galendromus occidentalis]|uniref:Uncharacterized protein LOC108864148 n=1 Tax=Galendromus occidentalis TaxID=34638 RepID=A0AAJ7L5P3_9ACAR|nr:uncharacterized protein LOC108864148 [Galendromus occidentalis]
MYSDNAGAYKRAAVDLQEISRLQQEAASQESMTHDGTEWTFNIAKAPPLCQVWDTEVIEVLTPMHFLIVETTDRLRESELSAKSRRSEMLAIWRHRKKVVEDVWEGWQDEYVSLLRSFHQETPSKNSSLDVGRVVIVKDNNTPRLFWKSARVEKLNISGSSYRE